MSTGDSGSHPSRGAWIEIAAIENAVTKFVSHPSRGAWIEIPPPLGGVIHAVTSHPSRGAWIEITEFKFLVDIGGSRTPHGVRGLKFMQRDMIQQRLGSHPSRGAWIEIVHFSTWTSMLSSHPSRGAWIEIICWAK